MKNKRALVPVWQPISNPKSTFSNAKSFPLRLVIEKNHKMTPQFIQKKHVLLLDHQPSIFISCFCKKARFAT
jgi:hypothetical protein